MGAGASSAAPLGSVFATAELRRRLHDLGFDEVKVVKLTTVGPEGLALHQWLAQGMHADMHWMARTEDRRVDPQRVLVAARSAILLGVNYATTTVGTLPRWARYALYEDYHETLKPALVASGRVLEELFGVSEADYRYYVDAGPILERAWAARAGLGFIGKNAMLISRGWGNWLLLAAIFTRLELSPDKVGLGEKGIGAGCGHCSRCLHACPTGALVQAGVVDARRCLSYLTIENKGLIPREWRTDIGLRIYGCDICAEVCPWNRFAQASRSVLLVPRAELSQLTLMDLLTLTPVRFAEVFRRTPVKRIKLAGLLRNACVVAGNSGDRQWLPRLTLLAEHDSPLVRAHAIWAVSRLAGDAEAKTLLAAAHVLERHPWPLAEYAAEGWAPT